MDTIATRIRALRQDLGLSQAELAEKVGYTDRSSVAKVEKGISNLTQSKIQAFADALCTTPQYLLGLTNDSYNYEIDPDGRFDQIESSRYHTLSELYGGDLEAIWNAFCRVEGNYEPPVADDGLHETVQELIKLISNCPEEKAKRLLAAMKLILANDE